MTYRPIRKTALMHSCAGAALLASLAFASHDAAAQGINATGTVVQGSAQIDDMVPGTTRVTVDTQDTVIDWAPDIDPTLGVAETYLPFGNTAIFQNGSNNTQFAVLNRILPGPGGNPALFQGLVQAILFDGAGNQTPGGFVAFYSPTGIIVGPTGRFEVPQLMLTTQAVDITTFGAFATGTGQMSLTGNTGSIDIQGGATLVGAPVTGGPEDSFLIVASPQITMAGDAYYNGSIAYVASTSVLLSHSSGLFDIIITGGVGGGQSITHTGSSGGPSSTGAGDEHVVYGVTRGAAGGAGVSMLFSGNLGFDPAAVATVVNGDIILSANYNVAGRTVDGDDNRQGANSFFDGRSFTPGVPGDILLTNVDASSNLLAIATDQVDLDAVGIESSFAADLSLVGRTQATINANNGGNVIVGGDLFVSARNFGEFTQAFVGIDATGGLASVRVGSDTFITVDGETMVAASALPGFDFSFGVAGAGTGGQAEVLAEGGAILMVGPVRMESYARFVPGSFPPGGYGAMQGGQVTVLASEGGFLSTPSTLSIDARAEAPTITNADPGLAAAVTGGQVLVGVGLNGGSTSITGDVLANANGEILSQTFNAGTGPTATGGSVTFSVLDTGTLTLGGNATGSADAIIGDVIGGGSAGTASGGSTTISTDGGAITIAGALALTSTAFGGDGQIGGNAIGGDTTLLTTGGLISVGGTATLHADGEGGSSIGGDDGGNGAGGSATLSMDGGTLATSGLTTISADGTGGTGIFGGDGTGGITTIDINNGGWDAAGIVASTNALAALGEDGDGGVAQGGETSLFLGLGGTIDLTGDVLLSSAAGTLAGSTTSGNGVSAIGGSAAITVDGGFVGGATAALDTNVTATGGAVDTPGFAGGTATGGESSLTLQNGGTVSVGSIAMESRGFGGDGVDGSSGGAAAGGAIDILVDGTSSTLSTAGSVDLTTRADGGDTTAAGVAGGSADGGIINVVITQATADIGLDLDARASALGGVGPQGGDATGGEVTFDFTTTSINIGGDYSMLADAGSGFDPSGTGSGGFAQGGSISLLIDDSTFTAPNATGGLTTDAIAGGSAGAGVGGSATGGTILVDIDNGSNANLGLDFGLFSLAVSGGSNGGDGGTGIGGDNQLLIAGGSDVSVGSITYETTVTGNFGATGGDATGGSNLLDIIGATFNSTDLTIFGAVVTRPDNATGTGGSATIRLSDGAVGSFGDTYLEAFAEAVGAGSSSISGPIIIEATATGAPSSATFGDTEFFNDALGGATNTSGVIQVNAVNGSIGFNSLLISNLGDVYAGTPSQIIADDGSITIASALDFISFGDILLAYANGGTISGGPSPADLTANFDITAVDHTIEITGDDAASRNIAALGMTLTSDFITVGANTRFGGSSLVLNSTNTDDTAILGGAAPGGGYSLLADEAAAIDAGSLTINLPAIISTSLAAIIDDIAFSGSDAGSLADITINADGGVDVIGALSYTSLGSSDTLTINASDLLQITLPAGSISLDNSGAPAGLLVLNAPSLIAADATLAADILSDPTSAAVADALLDDGGAASPSAYLTADRIEITATDLIYGQNTGANDIYGGITVGAGGLLLTQSPGAPDLLRVIAFGQRDDGTGILTNNDFFFVVEFATDLAGTYFDTSTFNNCIIVTQTCPTVPVDPVDPVDVPITNQILIEQPIRPKTVTEEGATTNFDFGFDFPSLLDAPLISEDEVVREPVTSGADSAVHALTGSALIEDEDQEEDK